MICTHVLGLVPTVVHVVNIVENFLVVEFIVYSTLQAGLSPNETGHNKSA